MKIPDDILQVLYNSLQLSCQSCEKRAVKDKSISENDLLKEYLGYIEAIEWLRVNNKESDENRKTVD